MKLIVDLLTIVSLCVIILLRLFEVDAGIIGILTYISVLFALYYFYSRVENEFGDFGNRFLSVRGIFIVFSVMGSIILILMLSQIILLSSKAINSLAIVALLISLPKELYCSLLKKYITASRRM